MLSDVPSACQYRRDARARSVGLVGEVGLGVDAQDWDGAGRRSAAFCGVADQVSRFAVLAFLAGLLVRFADAPKPSRRRIAFSTLLPSRTPSAVCPDE
jgi:hypothetical protein